MIRPAAVAAALLAVLAGCGSSVPTVRQLTETTTRRPVPSTEWVTAPTGDGRCLIIHSDRPWQVPEAVACYPIGSR